MSKVTFNQTGYCGCSMSARARDAYESGEMPKSKRTKAAMLAALREWADDNDRAFDEGVAGMRKSDIFDQLFYCSSWHHTSKFANETDFYSVDEDAAAERFALMDADVIAARHAARQTEREASLAAAEARNEAAIAAAAAFVAEHEAARGWAYEHGCEPWSIAAALLVCPERCRSWTSRKGVARVGVLATEGYDARMGNEMACPLADAWCAVAADGFDARRPETYGLLAVRAEGDFVNSGSARLDRPSIFGLCGKLDSRAKDLEALWAERVSTLNL